jgi:iron complex outermembrane receptor protein
VLVNGVRVNNPQTGHHHLDLFVPLAAVERIEVLYGSGAAVHGPDAFGGAINIVTAPPSTSAWARFGDHDLAGGGIAGSFGPGLWAAAEREVHTGFRDNTEADVNQLAGGWSWRREEASVDVMVAGGSRDFGAHRFYSARFPDQRESTEGELVTVRASTPLAIDGPYLDGSLRVGSHRDDFILDREDPDWFRNRHRTDGALVSGVLRSDDGPWRWSVGVEGAREELDSTNLGDRHLVRTAVFAETAGEVGAVTWSVQARADHQDDWGTEPTWGVGGSWRIDDDWRLRAHVGTSFRVPSFTDLYYTSPSTVGNPELEPEQGRSAEVGVDHRSVSVTAFERQADPIIDYLLGDDGVWRAANAGRVTTRGLEVSVTLPRVGRLRWQRLGGAWLDSELDVDPLRSAYALAHPELEAAWTGAVDAGGGWIAGWTVRYRQPQDAGSWATLDLRVGRRMLEAFELTLEASNVFDREITELHGVPLPGRWVSLTAAWRPEVGP